MKSRKSPTQPPLGVDTTTLGLFLYLLSAGGALSVRRVISGAGVGWASFQKRLLELERLGWVEIYPSAKKGGLTIKPSKKLPSAEKAAGIVRALGRKTVAGKRAIKANDVGFYYLLLSAPSAKKIAARQYALKLSAREIKSLTGLDYATVQRILKRLTAAQFAFVRPGTPSLKTKNTFTLVC